MVRRRRGSVQRPRSGPGDGGGPAPLSPSAVHGRASRRQTGILRMAAGSRHHGGCGDGVHGIPGEYPHRGWFARPLCSCGRLGAKTAGRRRHRPASFLPSLPNALEVRSGLRPVLAGASRRSQRRAVRGLRACDGFGPFHPGRREKHLRPPDDPVAGRGVQRRGDLRVERPPTR